LLTTVAGILTLLGLRPSTGIECWWRMLKHFVTNRSL